MKRSSGVFLTLGAGLLLGGCAAATTAGAPAIACPEGVPTALTGPAREARDALVKAQVLTSPEVQRPLLEEARTAAEQAVTATPANPWGFAYLGEAEARLGNFEPAVEAFEQAEEICPAIAAETAEPREAGWVLAFNQGVEAYNAQNIEQAVELWTAANELYALNPQSFQNLAAVYTQQGDYDQAVQAYRGGLAALERQPAGRELTPEEQQERQETLEAIRQNLAELLLFTEQYAEAERLYREQLAADPENVSLQSKLAAAIAAQPGREAEAQTLYAQLLSRQGLPPQDLMSIGVALFQSKDFERAAEAFKRVAELRPNSRDAWYNYANALYAGEEWAALVPVAEKLVTVDPLNEDAWLILARAYRDTKQNQKALEALQRLEAIPVKTKQLELRLADGRTTVRGQVIGNQAAAGTPVQLRFTFYADGATLGTETVTVTAPAKDAVAPFEVTLQNETPATSYSYELVR